MGIRKRLSALSPLVLVAMGAVLVAGLAAGGVFAYRSYNYIQHDNDFCMSCHLMQDPYERFARSAHRDLGCKACHQPTFAQRSSMAMTQVLENPDSLSQHAEVPNEVCEDCHVRGDPDEWLLISQSVGHRIHLESSDSVLEGLKCVECHSTSLHEFAASDRTCGQAGCHESTGITLGGMGALTIHCATCHDFNAPAPAISADSLAGSLSPQREECLSCHAMRQMVTDIPADDPHGGRCGACHNPHEQSRPADAVASCATAGCHESVAEVTPYHRGIEEASLTNCLLCHRAHDFSLAGEQCTSCHTGATSATTVAPVRVADMEPAERPFRHETHTEVSCTSCHNSQEAHGQPTVTTATDCQACHHSAERAEPCTACHATATLVPARVSRSIALDIGLRANRSLPFDHAVHTSVTCGQCHADGVGRSAATVDCASCHREHHEPSVTCMACHAQPRANAHTLSAHVTCAGAGCHESQTYDPLPRTREFCLVCHQDLVDHRPGQDCASCHALTGNAP